jgi:hypothetical protein
MSNRETGSRGTAWPAIAEACRGETIVLTDGDKQVTLEPRGLDLEEDSPELEAANRPRPNPSEIQYGGGGGS